MKETTKQSIERLKKFKQKIKEGILKDYKEANQKQKEYFGVGFKITPKGLKKYKYKVSNKEANKKHKKYRFIHILKGTLESNKVYLNRNLKVLKGLFSGDKEILKILKEVGRFLK